jgi:hypothetical protein
MSHLDPNAFCDRCHWWQYEDDGIGKCSHEPPTVTVVYNPDLKEIEELTCWPMTSAGDYCSRFTPMADATPTPTP